MNNKPPVLDGQGIVLKLARMARWILGECIYLASGTAWLLRSRHASLDRWISNEEAKR